MGSKTSKQRKPGAMQSTFVSSASDGPESTSSAKRGKSERQLNEEARAKRVSMLCQWITDSDVESEVADFMKQLRELCAELTARLYARTELQVALVEDADTVATASAKAMDQFSDNDTIIAAGLEIFQFMEAASWEGKHDGRHAAEQVLKVIDGILTKNQENAANCFASNDLEKMMLCVEITKSLVIHQREPIQKPEYAQMLLNVLTSVPQNVRKDMDMVGFMLAEKLAGTKAEDVEKMSDMVLELMVQDGVSLCEMARRRWSDAGDDYVSPLIRSMVRRQGIDIDSSCSVSGKTALIMACESNQKGVVAFLIDNGADLERADINGRTSLISAVSGAHLKIVELLLEKGAMIGTEDKEGNTALHHAVQTNNLEVVTAILTRIDENSKQILNSRNATGMTPLHIAVWERTMDEDTSVTILKQLIAAGADVSLLTPTNGASALILAVHRRRNLETLKALVDAGCPKSIVCQGMTAFDVAWEEGADDEECSLLKID